MKAKVSATVLLSAIGKIEDNIPPAGSTRRGSI